MDILIYALLGLDAILILFLTFGKGKKGALIPAVILAVLSISIMFYTADSMEVFYLGGLLFVAIWAAKVGLE